MRSYVLEANFILITCVCTDTGYMIHYHVIHQGTEGLLGREAEVTDHYTGRRHFTCSTGEWIPEIEHDVIIQADK